VVGLHDVSRRARSGDPIVVDGESGTVEIDPSSDRLEGAARRREAWLRRESVLDSVPPVAPATRDGVRLVLRANIELPEQLAPAVRLGAEGIGLYRSEFLFLTRAPGLPTEEEHCAAYRAMAESVAPHPAVIRTLDLGGDKYFQEVLAEGGGEASLGLRAVRFCLRRPDVFLPQLRGLLRAGVHGDVRVLVPMVTSRDEIIEVRRLLAREAETLKAHGVPCRDTLPLGAMVEVPAAAATADALAEVCDFLSIGTNDLIQYALAVDRGDDAVAHLYRPLHPGVLRMMDFTVRSAAARGIPVSLCGEMAGDPGLAALLVGLGLRELSVEPRVLPAVAEAVRQVDAAAAASLAVRALALGDAAAVERLVHGEPRGA
jgi:phosphotransferase system enzyme I (PtsI)